MTESFTSVRYITMRNYHYWKKIIIILSSVIILSGCLSDSEPPETEEPLPPVITPPEPVNVAPVFNSSSTVSVPENQTETGYVANANDADNDTLTYSISGGPDASLFIIDSVEGVLSFNEAPDFEIPLDVNTDNNYEITLAVSDGDTLTYSISAGDDASLFSIDNMSGLLSFNEAPDFEMPGDADTDNNYELTLSVDDGNGGSDTIDVTIIVTDLEETSQQLSIRIDYPSANANLGGNALTTRVTGIVLDENNNAVSTSNISSLTVNDEDVTFAAEDNGVWSVEVPLNALSDSKLTELNVILTDSDSNVSEYQQDVFNFSRYLRLQDIIYDEENNRYFVADRVLAEIHAVNLMTNERQVIFSNSDIGPTLGSPKRIAYDSLNEQIIVVDSNINDSSLSAVITIDIETGNHSILSDNATGSGIAFGVLEDLYLDSENNRVLVIDSQRESLIAVDLDTGNRTTIANNGLDFPSALTVDTANNRALVVDSVLDALLAIDLTTGMTSVISDDDIGTGDDFFCPLSITLDADNNQVFIGDGFSSAKLFSVDLSTGNRTIVSGGTVGSGTFLARVNGIVIDAENNRLVVTDEPERLGRGMFGKIVAVDLTDGTRTTLEDSRTGNGTPIVRPDGLQLDNENNRVFVVANAGLISIDLVTSERTVISSDTIGDGPALTGTNDLYYDHNNNRVLVTANSNLLAVNLANGDRTIISSNDVGSGKAFGIANKIAMDIDNNRVFISDSSNANLHEVNLTTGDRTVIVDETTGTGPRFNGRSIIYDHISEELFAIGNRSVLSIDISTGDRSIVSDESTGIGTDLIAPISLGLIAGSDNFYAYDQTLSAVVQINRATGDRVVISQTDYDQDLITITPADISIDQSRALILDFRLQAIFIEDLTSGERGILAY